MYARKIGKYNEPVGAGVSVVVVTDIVVVIVVVTVAVVVGGAMPRLLNVIAPSSATKLFSQNVEK